MVAGDCLEGGERAEDVERFKGSVEDDAVVDGSVVVGGWDRVSIDFLC